MCPICKNKKTKIIYSDLSRIFKVHIYGIHKNLDIRKCLSCGAVFTNPQLDYKDLNQYFSDEYRAFAITSASSSLFGSFKKIIHDKTLEQFFGYGRPKWWRFILSSFKIPLAHYPKKINNGRVLDVGCGSGNLLVNLKNLGWEVYGIDPSPIAVNVARSRGLDNIYQGELNELKLNENFFDVIILFHVFEHIPNPETVLLEIKRILKPGGRLIIGVPNFGSFASRIMGKYWAGLSFPLHFFHYQKQSLSNLLKARDFNIKNIYYANFFSDIFVSTPENILSVAFNYKLPVILAKIARFANLFFGALDYLFGNLLSNFFSCGSQITIISENKK